VRAAPSDPRARGFGSVTGGCAVARWFELVLARRRCRRQQAIGSSGRTQPRTRGPSDRPPPPAAPRSGRVSNRLATPKVAGQTRCLQMWSGRLTLPRPDETCHNVKDPGNQEALASGVATAPRSARRLKRKSRCGADAWQLLANCSHSSTFVSPIAVPLEFMKHLPGKLGAPGAGEPVDVPPAQCRLDQQHSGEQGQGSAVASACPGHRLANLRHPLPDYYLSAPPRWDVW
jgi:hypothetical protein